MPKFRTTVGMAMAVSVCVLLLWTLQHGGPTVSDAPGLLFPRGLSEAESLIVEQGAFRMDLQRQGGRWRQVEPFAAEVDQLAVQRTLGALSDIAVRERISLDELRRRELQLKDFGLSPAQTRVIVRTASRRIELCFGRQTPDGSEVYFYLDAAAQVLVTARTALEAVPVSIESVRERALLRDNGRSVTALELRRPGAPYVKLTRGGGDWQMTQPVAAAADRGAVERILSSLRQARIEAFVWPSGYTNDAQTSGNLGSRLAIYGLDAEASVQVQLWETGGPAGVRLRFGKPVDGHPGWVYVRTVDEQSVVAVTNDVLQTLLATPSELRDRRLFRESPDEITRMQLCFADQLVECRRDAKNHWALVSPQQDAADQEQVRRLLMGLLSLRAQRIDDLPAGMAAVSGQPTDSICRVEYATAAQTSRFDVSPDATTGLMDIVFTNAPATRYVVAASNLPPAVLAPSAAFGLRDRIVLAVATSAVRRITVRRDTETESVERGPDSVWQVSGAPADKVVANEALAAWLSLLSGLPAMRIERLGGVSATVLDACGLSSPTMEIKVEQFSSDGQNKLLIGGSAVGGRYAQLRGHDVIFVLSAETMRVIDRHLAQP